MIFSVDTIKDSRNRSTSEKNDYINFENTNCFQISLDMVLEESLNFNNMICTNEGIGSFILGAGLDALNKAIEAINPYNILANIFDWFVNSIAKLGRHFEAFLLNFMNDNIELKSFRSKLEQYRGSVRLLDPYYEYRNLEISTSYTTYEAEIEREYDSLIADLTQLSRVRTNTEIADYMNNMSMMNQYVEEEIDSMRGRVLGLNRPVTREHYADELFLFFRTTSTPIDPKFSYGQNNISGDRVHQAAKDYYNFSAQKMRIRRDIIKMRTEANKEKSKCKSVRAEDFIPYNLSMDSSVIRVYNSIVTNKCKKIQAVCDVYVTMFGAKLDALKEYNVTNKKILLEACKQIVREGK